MRKRLSFIFLGMFLILGLFCPTEVKADEVFTIEDFTIKIEIDETGKFNIDETYILDFDMPRHGFYRTIPNYYEMNWIIDGKPVDKEYYFPISDISCHGTNCEIERNAQGTRIQLGDGDRYVEGEQTYHISYTIQSRDLDLNGSSMFYWNLIGGFDTQVEKMNYEIIFPTAIEQDAVFTSTGYFGENNQTLSAEVNGNVVSGELLLPLNNNENATIKVDLPDYYFNFPKQNQNDFLILLFDIVLVGLAVLFFFRFGKDEMLVVPVAFAAPKGLNSAGVGYVVDGSVENKDVLSLIIDWANRGYISIHEDHERLSFTKLREMDEDVPLYERRFFNRFFKKGDVIDEDSYQNGQLADALQSCKSGVRQYFSTKKRRIYVQSSSVLQMVMAVVSVLPLVVYHLNGSIVYYGTMEFAFAGLFPLIFLLIVNFLWIVLIQRKASLKTGTFVIGVLGATLLSGVLIGVSCLSGWLNYKTTWFQIVVTIISTMVLIVCMIFMNKRTSQGQKWLGEILGLKDFILNCEKERLEMLVHEQPQLFFSILPYAYVLGISDVWSKRLEGMPIVQPQWYSSTSGELFTTYYWWRRFDRQFHHISQQAITPPAPTGGRGGGSFSSGGFSGGGFSGGGFGGGGGGSW